MSLIDDIKRDREAGTKGPWSGHNMVHADGQRPMTAEEIGEYVMNSVKMGDPNRFLFVSGKHDDGGDCDICHTGNGPRGPANTRRIARVPDMEAALLAAEELAEAVESVGEAASLLGFYEPPLVFMEKETVLDALKALTAFQKAVK